MSMTEYNICSDPHFEMYYMLGVEIRVGFGLAGWFFLTQPKPDPFKLSGQPY